MVVSIDHFPKTPSQCSVFILCRQKRFFSTVIKGRDKPAIKTPNESTSKKGTSRLLG